MADPLNLLDGGGGFADARRAAAAMGAWTSAAHAVDHARRPMRNVSAADDLTLSEEHLYWVSELGRLTELAGALVARVDVAAAAAKTARAKARAALRRAEPDVRWSVQSLDDAVEDDDTVAAADADVHRLRLAAAHVTAAKDATAGYVAGLSREITLRGDGRRSRTY